MVSEPRILSCEGGIDEGKAKPASGRLLDEVEWETPDADYGILLSVRLHPVSDICRRELPLDPCFPRQFTLIGPMVTSRGQIRRVGHRQECTQTFVSNRVVEFAHKESQRMDVRHLLSMT